MSARWDSAQLLQPITADRPCGENLEDTELLASFDAFRLFGQAKPLDAPGRARMRSGYRSRRNRRNGSRFATRPSTALAKSKDLRLLAYLGTALLRTDGVPAFSETLHVASQWLETYWSQTYPLVDEDAGCLPAQRVELLCRSDGGRRRAPTRAARPQPSARHVQPSRHRHRDASAVAGRRQTPRWTRTRVNAAFASMPLAELDAAPRQRRRRGRRRCRRSTPRCARRRAPKRRPASIR